MRKLVSIARTSMSALTIAISCAGLLGAGTLAFAQGKGPPENRGQGQAVKHKPDNKSGPSALGAKLKQDGKHAVGKFKDRTVTAEVKGGKVRSMTAGNLPVKMVRSPTKVASIDGNVINVADTGNTQLAQAYDTYYYAFCFDDGFDFICYWYAAYEVYYTDYTWYDYTDYYYY